MRTTVTADQVVYMGFETALGDHFFTEDPIWAEDFAPNGIYFHLKLAILPST
jgi:hypothetical protein